MKADCVGETTVCLGGTVVAAGVVKSKRSPRPELELATGAGVTPGAEPKSPKPLDELKARDA